VETETKNTIPLWLAVAITVVVALPFGVWLDKLDLPIWASFIVWAEYFVLGAKPSALKTMVPAYTLGVIGGALICIFFQVLWKATGSSVIFNYGLRDFTGFDLALFVSFFIGFCILIYAMKYMPVTGGGGTLPFFNGISMLLAVYFAGLSGFNGGFGMTWFKDFNVTGDTLNYMLPVFCAIAAILAGLLGAFLGWFNVVILFPREVKKTSPVAEPARS
jgi:hypothetical protein